MRRRIAWFANNPLESNFPEQGAEPPTDEWVAASCLVLVLEEARDEHS
jgi:hypothetical protein